MNTNLNANKQEHSKFGMYLGYTLTGISMLETIFFSAVGVYSAQTSSWGMDSVWAFASAILMALAADLFVFGLGIKIVRDLFNRKNIVSGLLLLVLAFIIQDFLNDHNKIGLDHHKESSLRAEMPDKTSAQRKIDSLALVFDQKESEVEKLYLPKNETLIKSLEKRLVNLHADLDQKEEELEKIPADIKKMYPKKYDKALSAIKELETKIDKTNQEIEKIEENKTEMLSSDAFRLEISKIETEKEAKISEIKKVLSANEQEFLAKKANSEVNNTATNTLFRAFAFAGFIIKVSSYSEVSFSNFCLLIISFLNFLRGKKEEDQQTEQTIIGKYAKEDYEAIFKTIVSKLPENAEVTATYLAEQALLETEKTHQSSENIARYARTYIANLKTEQHSKTVVGKLENAINTIKQLLFGKAQTPKSEPAQAKNEKTAPQAEPITKAETPRKTVNPNVKPDMTGRKDLKLKYTDKQGHLSTKIITFSEGNDYQNAEEAVAEWIEEGKSFEDIAEILKEATNVQDYDHVHFYQVFVKIWDKKASEKLSKNYGFGYSKHTPSRVKIAED